MIGDDELATGSAVLKNMVTGEQQTINQSAVVSVVK